MDQPLTTPVRQRFARSGNGLIYVGASALTYADGSENRMLELLRSCDDLGSMSTEMLDKSVGWAERYHSHPARANVVRAIGVPRNATILEVGAGCGGVTRYLGEQGVLVDALEPMEDRAVVARERTRDLPSVEVLVGEVSDLPPEPTYDLVVVVGVLEYVGLGSADRTPYIEFLAHIRSLLNEGGSLILAIENKLGVKYLVGAPEDHTNQVFDSVEGYPRGERARTFSKKELLELVKGAGLDGEALAAFPDYKITRAVLSPKRVPRDAMSLLVDIPTFPSPDWTGARPRLASERLVWREFVRAGLADEVPNSLVILAGKGGASTLWPNNRVGTYYRDDAARGFAVETNVLVRESDHTLVDFEDRLLNEHSGPGIASQPLSTHPFIHGLNFAEQFAHSEHEERVRLAELWRELAFVEATEGGSPLEFAVFVRHDGSLAVRPSPLMLDDVNEQQSLMRGALWVGIEAAEISAPSSWPGATTVRDVVEYFGALARVSENSAWLVETVALEAVVQSAISIKYPPSTAVASWINEIEELLARELSAMDLGQRSFEREAQLAIEVESMKAAFAASQDLLAEAQREVERLRSVSSLSRRRRQ